RAATGQAEIWTVEGLIQPGLKNAMFTFQKNALTAVRLHCQYEAWPVQRYGTRLEELKTFFQQKYGNQQAMPAPAGAPPLGYVWRRGETELSVSCPIDHAPGGKPLSVCSLVMRYHI